MDPKFLVVLPYVVQDWADACLETCRFGEEGRLMTVDNTAVNKGIMRSHNLALDERQDDEWLIIMSAALRFGPAGGLDFIKHLTTYSDHGVISASGTFGWHLVAFRPDVVAQMGRWDENFTPYGYDDLDLSIRIHKLMPDLLWGGDPLDVQDMGMAHSIKIGNIVTQRSSKLISYWYQKWGAAPGSEFHQYMARPFGSRTWPVNYWPAYKGAEWNQKAPENR